MNATQASSDDTGGAATVASVATNLELIVISVSDVDRAKEFYGRLGWRLDGGRFRRVDPAATSFPS